MKNAFVIFEYTGHHLHFAALVLDALIRLNKEIVVIAPKDTLVAMENILKKSIQITTKVSSRNKLQTLYNAVQENEYEFIYVNALDACWIKSLFPLLLQRVFKKNQTKLCGLLVSGSFAYRDNRKLRLKWLKRLLLRWIAPFVFFRIFLIDSIAYSILFPHGNRCCQYLPDPIEDIPYQRQKNLRERKNIPIENKILLAAGVINEWKRIDLLLEAFLMSSPSQNEYLYIIGKFTPEVKRKIKNIQMRYSYREQVHIEDRFLEEYELGEYIQMADAVAVTYPNFFSNASFYFRSIICRKPVLVANSGWLGRIMTQEKCGIAVDPFSPGELGRAIKKILYQGDLPSDISSRMRELHREKTFIAKISHNLQIEKNR